MLALLFAVLINFYDRNNSNINVIPSHTEFVVYYILHGMSRFHLSEVDAHITKSKITEVELFRRFNIRFALYVISRCSLKKERILKVSDILLNCRTGYFGVFNSFKCSLQFLGSLRKK